MQIKKIFALPVIALMAVTVAFYSCDKGGDDGGDKQIELPDQTEKNQQAFADEETTGGFTFTAKAPWTATVTEGGSTRAGSVSWLRLLYEGEEKYSGEAGTFTLAIEIDENYTGQTRTATITVTAGTSKITVTVTQDGKTEDGVVPEIPRLITSITRANTLNSGIDASWESDSYEFDYDNDYRLKEFLIDLNGSSQGYSFDYTTKNEVIVTENGEYGERWSAKLNSKGYVTNIEETTSGHTYPIALTYDSGDNLKRADQGELGNYWDYIWEKGNLVEIRVNYETGDNYLTPLFATQLNDKANIDWNVFIQRIAGQELGYDRIEPLPVNLLAMIDKAGKRSANYVVPMLNMPENLSLYILYTEATEPAVGAIVGTYYDQERSGNPYYTFDSDGWPTNYSWKISVTKSEATYTGERKYVEPRDEYERQQWEEKYGPGPWFELGTTIKVYPAVIDTYQYNVSYNR